MASLYLPALYPDDLFEGDTDIGIETIAGIGIPGRAPRLVYPAYLDAPVIVEFVMVPEACAFFEEG